MEVDDLMGTKLSVKDLEPKLYVRVLQGEPQLVRVEPLYTDDGEVVPGYCKLFVDEEEMASELAREVALAYVTCENHVPLAQLLNWKHLLVH
jgi:hypothetical protein